MRPLFACTSGCVVSDASNAALTSAFLLLLLPPLLLLPLLLVSLPSARYFPVDSVVFESYHRLLPAPPQLLQEMKERGVHLSAQSYTLAMAACLESHRDRRPEIQTGLHGEGGPSAADLQLAEVSLSLFERLVGAGETPTASTYALALKVRR